MKKYASCLALVIPLCLVFIAPPSLAQTASSGAFGDRVDITINQTAAIVEVNSGPTPAVSGEAPPDYDLNDVLASITVDTTAEVIDAADTVQFLDSGTLTVNADGSTSPLAASADATVENVALDAAENALLTAFFGLDADAIASTADASGSCGDTLTVNGTTTLTNAVASGSAAETASVDGAVAASPAPNTVLLDAAANGGQIRVVLNEQLVSGNGTDSLRIVVNAVHLTITNVTIAGLGIVNEDIIIAQSEAGVSCAAGGEQADLSLVKTDAPDPAVAGATLTYTLLVSNAGPDTASDVRVVDILPDSVTFQSATAEQGICSRDGRVVDCQLGNIAAGNDVTITIEVTPGTDGNLTNSASVTADTEDPNLDNNSDIEATQVGPTAATDSADLTLDITASPDPVAVGDPLTFELDVDNAGPDAAEDTTVSTVFSPSVMIDGVATTTGSCQVIGQTVSCDLGTVAAAGSALITVETTPTVTGQVSASGTVNASTPDPNLANNSDADAVTVRLVVFGTERDPSNVPTLSQWALILLALALAGLAARRFRYS